MFPGNFLVCEDNVVQVGLLYLLKVNNVSFELKTSTGKRRTKSLSYLLQTGYEKQYFPLTLFQCSLFDHAMSVSCNKIEQLIINYD